MSIMYQTLIVSGTEDNIEQDGTHMQLSNSTSYRFNRLFLKMFTCLVIATVKIEITCRGPGDNALQL